MLLASLVFSGCLINEALYLERMAALTDDDGDGFHEDAGDCDDANPAVFPGADEACNGVDDDCDGEVDEDPVGVAWYDDIDGDGHGAGTAVNTCSPARDLVALGDDCDDAAATTYPGAAELCNDIDDDCDGDVDEAGEVETRDWYSDVDRDGYGGDLAAQSCEAPAGATLIAGDCDDENASVNPGATETCNGLDDDCNGVSDDAPAVTWYLDRDADGYGDDGTTYESCEPPPGYSLERGDCDDLDGDVHPAAEELC